MCNMMTLLKRIATLLLTVNCQSAGPLQPRMDRATEARGYTTEVAACVLLCLFLREVEGGGADQCNAAGS
jgi:hypothetical protein